MAGRGVLRGVMASWLGLIALHAAVSNGGSGRISEFLGDVDRLVQRALDPTVPAIPDLRAGESWGTTGTKRPATRAPIGQPGDFGATPYYRGN